MTLLGFTDFNEPTGAGSSWFDRQSLITLSASATTTVPVSTYGEDGRGIRWGDAAGDATGSCAINIPPGLSGNLIWGCRYFLATEGATSGGVNDLHFGMRNATGQLAYLVRTGGPATRVLDSTGAIIGSVNIARNEWMSLEFRLIVGSGGSGRLTIWQNGVQIFDDTTGDYDNGGGNCDTIDMGSSSTIDVDDQRFDRVWVMDSSGSAPFNAPIGGGGLKAAYALPDGNGNQSDFVGSDGNSTDNYLLVDEDPYDTADYVQAGTEADVDLYTYAALSGVAGTDISAVQVLPLVYLPDGGGRFLRGVTRISATDYTSASVAVADGKYLPLTFLTNPNTAATWTVSDVNGAEFGVEVRDT